MKSLRTDTLSTLFLCVASTLTANCVENPSPSDASRDARADGSLPHLDATAIDGTLSDASNSELGPPLANRIQVQVTFECRLGGAQFIATPTTPYAGTEGYTFRWERTMGRARFEPTGNSVVAFNNETNDQIHFNLHVSRAGYADAVFEDIWTNPCPTGADLPVCPLNDHRMVTNQESYRLGDAFRAELLGVNQGVSWYDNLGISQEMQNRNAHTLTGVVSGFPIRVHAQIDDRVGPMGPRQCSGWTIRYFTADEAPPSDGGMNDVPNPPPVDVPNPPPVDVPDPPAAIADRIQAQVMQECREGGVKFTAVPTTPFRGTAGYSFQWMLFEGSAPYVVNNNSVVIQNTDPGRNWPGYPMHFSLTIRRAGYPDAVLPDVWSNPCNHDDNPIDCPENTREVLTNQETYAPGDMFVARYPGAGALTLAAPWYGLDGLTNAVFSDDGRTLMARVQSLPIRVHAQINAPQMAGQPRICHGWTERYFFNR